MTSLYQQALDLYKGDTAQMEQEASAILRLMEGRIVATQGLMLWGFPVHIGDELPESIEIEDYADPDAWMVWLAVGKVSFNAVMSAMPYPLPRVIFARDNRLKCYNLERLIQHLPP